MPNIGAITAKIAASAKIEPMIAKKVAAPAAKISPAGTR